MLLPEPELDQFITAALSGLVDLTSGCARTAEVHSDCGLGGCRHANISHVHVALVHETVSHGAKQTFEVRPTILGFGLELSKGVEVVAYSVQVDIGGSIRVDFLREVGMDAQEFRSAIRGGSLLRLHLK